MIIDKNPKHINSYKVTLKGDTNDADYVADTILLSPHDAYFKETMDAIEYLYLNSEENNQYTEYHEPVNPLPQSVEEGLEAFSVYGAHTIWVQEILYFDEQGIAHNVTFE